MNCFRCNGLVVSEDIYLHNQLLHLRRCVNCGSITDPSHVPMAKSTVDVRDRIDTRAVRIQKTG